MLTCAFKQELVLLFDAHRSLCLQLVVEQRADTAMSSYAAVRKPSLPICMVMGSAEPCELYPLRWSDPAYGPPCACRMHTTKGPMHRTCLRLLARVPQTCRMHTTDSIAIVIAASNRPPQRVKEGFRSRRSGALVEHSRANAIHIAVPMITKGTWTTPGLHHSTMPA